MGGARGVLGGGLGGSGGGGGGGGGVLAGEVAGVSLLLLDAPHLYDREGGPYSGPAGDWQDNAQRFAALSWVAARIAREGLSDGWAPQILHVHDWQAALAPAYLAYGGGGGGGVGFDHP
jgi:starch synthase